MYNRDLWRGKPYTNVGQRGTWVERGEYGGE